MVFFWTGMVDDLHQTINLDFLDTLQEAFITKTDKPQE